MEDFYLPVRGFSATPSAAPDRIEQAEVPRNADRGFEVFD